MKKQKFEIGDRVRFTRDVIGFPCKGCTGTVTKAESAGCEVSLATPLKVSVVETRTWIWGYYEDLELVKREKQPVIVITSDGKTTTAIKRLGKKVIHTATAVCSDNDTFDFNTGAELAMDRLMETEQPVPKEKPWPKKLVCVEVNRYPEDFCIGRVYRTVPGPVGYGRLYIEDGSFWGICKHSDTDFRINIFPDYARFIPLVED